MKEFLIVMFIFFLVGICHDVRHLSDGEYPRKSHITWEKDVITLVIRAILSVWIGYLLIF